MLQNAYFLAKIGADTAENEQHFAEILPIGRRVAASRGPPAELRGLALSAARAAPRAGRARAAPRLGRAQRHRHVLRGLLGSK